ncbi:beta-1,3-galactosyltransferase brn-like [Saccostrea echinata]|uniref:beta-1,3-galactosyltransferase brn-like n=1 Tax=Saccostrea echinata TaxID=191078 RepID=UPI002A8379A0|nr:beta-1,3-galactosyltransferase brn-like [Saccostrea echinata]
MQSAKSRAHDHKIVNTQDIFLSVHFRQSKTSVIKSVLPAYLRSPKRALLLAFTFFPALLLLIQICVILFGSNKFIYKCNKDYGYPLHKTVVNPHPYRYITNVSSTCTNIPEVYVITLVKSAAGNFKQRHYIRRSWGIDAKKKNLRLVFLLGYDKENQFKVEYEQNMHGDIVQQDFQESYYNNTIKVTMALNWVTTFCKNAKYIQIVDDDMFLNIQNALNFLQNKSVRYYFYAGYRIRNPILERDNQSKWYIPHTYYSFDCFPSYIAGGYVLMNIRTVIAFQKIIPNIPSLPFDDVYFGIISLKLSITPTHIKTLDVSRTPTSRGKIKHFIALHDYKSLEDFLYAYSVTHNRF